MSWRSLVSGVIFALGIAGFLAAAALVAYAQLAPAEGLEDLGRVVGAMLAVAMGGALLGLSLVLAWTLGVPMGGTRLVVAIFGCILAAIVAFGLLGSAIPANLGLAAFSVLVLLLAIGGIVASARLWRGGALVA